MINQRLLRATKTLLLLSVLLFLPACSSIGTEERHEIALTVVFLDETQLQQKWTELSGKPAVMLSPRLVLESHRQPERVVGFYDYANRTIYCPKMNFEVCGHELHHAVLGPFHYERY